jgi:acetyl-CoA C-acetyltransferase
MQEVWIIDTARSPRGLGRPDKGSLAHIHPQRLLSQLLSAVAERNQLHIDDIEHVIMGCGNPSGTQRGDIARMAALDAGWLHSSGTTVDHFCGSSLMATLFGANCISSGMHDLVVTGGIEMMSLPDKPNMATDQHNMHLRDKHPITSVGISADVIATEEGFFDKSIVPINNDDGSLALARDEYPRPGTSVETLAELKPVFSDFMNYPMDDKHSFGDIARMTWPNLDINHVHHAGNSSGIVDGAAVVVLASPEYARANKLKPRARIVSSASVAGSPEYNLNEPVPSAQKALSGAGLTVDDIDLFEVNEAFAVVPLRFMKLMGVDHDKLNVNGGAIALGHPIGATGAILLGTLLDELERRELKRGLVTLCAAGGLAPSMIIETM